MKNVILNNSKKLLSFLLAFSLVMVSVFTGVNIFTNAQNDTTDTWDGSYTQPTTTDASGNIIISTAEELAWVVLKSGTNSAGNVYKVADGTTAFYMNENTENLTLNQVKNTLDGNNTNTWNYQSNVFQGTLDGNGVTVYGLYSNGANTSASEISAFIPFITGAVTIKNIAIKNSYIAGYKYAAALIGTTVGDTDLTSLTIENCEISNNYIYQTRSSSTSSGGNYSASAMCGKIGARAVPCYITINNCAVYGNEIYSAIGGNVSGTFAYMYPKSDNANNNCYNYSNLLISGVTPWSGNHSTHARRQANFTNVYTDTDASSFVDNDGNVSGTMSSAPCNFADGHINLVATNNMQGEAAETNMPDLDWGDVWTINQDGFATLALFADSVADDDQPEEDDEEETLNIVYWDGTSEAPTKTDDSGNVLIESVAQLHYIAIKAGTTETTGKSYKIADGIDVMIMQPKGSVDAETLMGLTDYNAVKTYLTETVTEPKNWLDGVSDSVRFNGNFDGNGVQIYGLYATGSSVGLFPCGDGGTVYTTDGHTGCVYQNFAVRNSYLESSRRLGVIAAYCASGIGIGTVTAKNCEVSNCYIISTATTASYFGEAGVLIGRTTNELVKVDNCLVYGNYSYATGLDKQIPLYPCAYTGDSSALNTVENSIVLGTVPYPTFGTNSKTHGVNCFENVYTDQNLPTYTTYADTDMKKVALDDIKGTAAQNQMPGLDWENTWISVDGNYPALRIFYQSSSSGDSGEGEEPEQPEVPEIPEDIQDCAKNIIYWDNTKTDSSLADKGEKGTADDPIIIDSAEELNYLALYTNPNTTTEKHYKIADNIDAIILQPEAVVTALGGASKIMNLTSAAAVNTYFADMQTAGYTPSNWITVSVGNQFNGSFDGNGVKIYGMYAVATAGANSAQAAALFPVIDAGGTVENTEVETDFVGVIYKDIAIRNSYISSTRRIGALAACSYGPNYGGKVNGTINVDGIEVSNCYMRSTSTTEMETGLLLGTVATDLVNINNCLVYGNNTSWNKSGTVRSIPFVGASAKIAYGNNEVYENTLTNSIIFGVVPATQNDEAQFNGADNVENVYTDADFSTFATKYSYTDSDMKKVSNITEIGDALNATGKWLTSTDGTPSLYSFHDGLELVTSDATTHTHNCSCGVQGIAAMHVYDADYKCIVCDYQHVHSMVDVSVDTDADCVSGVMNTKCENCDYTSTREIPSGGHQFGAVVAATEGDCRTEATIAYKTCSSCGLHFAEDADIHSDEPVEYVGTGYTGRHNWVEQGTHKSECGGKESSPYFKCSVCDTYLVDGVMCETEPSESGSHTATGNYYIDKNTHANTCVTCGEIFGAEEHTDANQDSICDVCGWPCGEHIFDGASITLTDSIAVNYMVRQSVLDALGYENLYIDFTFRGKDYRVSNYTKTTIDGVAYYVFTFDKMAPDRMTDTIYATLCGTKDGAKYTSQISEYSIRQYCHNILAKSGDEDSELRTLLVDMLNYGAEAQLYSGYNVENLANAGLTEEQLSWGTQGAVTTESDQNLKVKEIDNQTVKWMGAGLYLDEEATLRFIIQTDNIENLVVKATCGTATFEIPASSFVKHDTQKNMYYVYVRGIKAMQMREPVYLTVYNGETEVSNTISYSVESYANAKIGGSDIKLSNLLVAMIKYGDAAKAYANKK